MKMMTGQSFRIDLAHNQLNFRKNEYLDVSIYPRKWTTHVSMNRWENGNSQALSFLDITYPNFERFVSKKLAARISKHVLNKQSQKVANIDLIS